MKKPIPIKKPRNRPNTNPIEALPIVPYKAPAEARLAGSLKRKRDPSLDEKKQAKIAVSEAKRKAEVQKRENAVAAAKQKVQQLKEVPSKPDVIKLPEETKEDEQVNTEQMEPQSHQRRRE